MIEIEASGRCNTRCLHCPREAISRPMGTMSWETYQVIADKVLADGRLGAVYFSGMGEPTMNPHLSQFIAYVSDHLPTAVTTNAAILTEALIHRLVDAGLGTVIVSCSGHTPELYGLMSGGLDLARFDDNVRDMVRIGGNTTKVAANVSVTLRNREHLGEIRGHLNGLGVHEMSFAMCHNRGGFLEDPSVCQTPTPPPGTTRCDIFRDTLYVAWDGRVLACCHDLAGQGYVGDLATEGLDAILERKQRIADQGVRFPMCAECNDMYRFGADPAPDGGTLSDWVYALCAHRSEAEHKLVEVIAQREKRIDEQQTRIQEQANRIRELEALVVGYESGRFIRFTKWLHDAWAKIASR